MPTDLALVRASSVNASTLLTTSLSFSVAAMSEDVSPGCTSTSTEPLPEPE